MLGKRSCLHYRRQSSFVVAEYVQLQTKHFSVLRVVLETVMYERGATLEMFLIETGAGYYYKRTTQNKQNKVNIL